MELKVWEFDLGVEVKDVITGFQGVIMARTEYLTGCDRFGVQPQKLDKDGKERDANWYDGSRLRQVGKGVELTKPKKGVPAKPGGPGKRSDLPPSIANRGM